MDDSQEVGGSLPAPRLVAAGADEAAQRLAHDAGATAAVLRTVVGAAALVGTRVQGTLLEIVAAMLVTVAVH